MTAHSTGIGALPGIPAVSWACTCGTARIITYRNLDQAYALRVAAAQAATHQRLANHQET
jgi:hypothetical protein